MTRTYGEATERKITQVMAACDRYGGSSIIALAGVPGTGKSFVALIAAQRHASDPCMVREVQFHQSFSYEEFVEGMRIDQSGGVVIKSGLFLEWNNCALRDPQCQYVLLIEELTRANIASVLGELMTYIEHRDRSFTTMYSRNQVKVATNLTIIATFNPTDRTALELDAALIRRLRIIAFPPDTEQLQEMLRANGLQVPVIDKIAELFAECQREVPDDFSSQMPFGHGIFAGVKHENPDLHELWVERIYHLLYRPFLTPHRLADVIKRCYPWRSSANFAVSTGGVGASDQTTDSPSAGSAAPEIVVERSGADPKSVDVDAVPDGRPGLDNADNALVMGPPVEAPTDSHDTSDSRSR